MKNIDPNAKLSLDNIKILMESTLRFEHIKNDKEFDSILFWDSDSEANVSLSYKSNWTVITIIDWILSYYSSEDIERGKDIVRREIRAAIGII